jgi:UDP-glucose 4-epimerase
VSIQELFDLAVRVTGSAATVKVDERRLRPDASEVQELVSSPARAAELLGWKPGVSLEDGIAETASWIREHLDSYRPERLHV